MEFEILDEEILASLKNLAKILKVGNEIAFFRRKMLSKLTREY